VLSGCIDSNGGRPWVLAGATIMSEKGRHDTRTALVHRNVTGAGSGW
jgi:hypothetical protein